MGVAELAVTEVSLDVDAWAAWVDVSVRIGDDARTLAASRRRAVGLCTGVFTTAAPNSRASLAMHSVA
jgi:hypothetical protein